MLVCVLASSWPAVALPGGSQGIMPILLGVQSGTINPTTGTTQAQALTPGTPLTSTALLVNAVSGGQMPPALAAALLGTPGLGSATNLTGLGTALSNPLVRSALTQMGVSPQLANTLTIAMRAILSPAGLTSVLSNPAALAALLQAMGLPAGIIPQILAQLTAAQPSAISPINNSQCPEPCPTCCNCHGPIIADQTRIRVHVTNQFQLQRSWIVSEYFKLFILPAMMVMTTQLTSTMMHQVQIIGSLLDAKHQLESHRLFQQLTAQAHKDYHPSEGMCAIGTNVRSLATSERRSDLGQIAFSQRVIQRQL